MKKLNAYSIELTKLLKSRGGFSDDLKNKILEHSQEYCRSLDDDLSVDSGWLPAITILKDFIGGKPFEIGSNSAKHWYVVELLCNGLGTELSNNDWENSSVNDLYTYDEFRMYFLGKDTLVRLPSPVTNPVVFTIENSNLEKAKLHIDKSSHSDAEKNEFIQWVKFASDNNQDLILFHY